MKGSIVVLVAAALVLGCKKDHNNGINDTDRNFALKAGMGNTAEIDAGQMASGKSQAQGIKSFGSMMVSDHTDAQNQLKTAAASTNLKVPDSLDAEHVTARNMLMSMSGRMFDSAYIHSQVNDHANTITLFEDEVANGNRQELRNLANSLLPKLRMHKQMADSLAKMY